MADRKSERENEREQGGEREEDGPRWPEAREGQEQDAQEGPELDQEQEQEQDLDIDR